MELTQKKKIMSIYIIRFFRNSTLLTLVFFTLYGCSSKRFMLSNHINEPNCMLSKYIYNELNENDSNYDKIILFRTNFCGNELCTDDLYKAMNKYVTDEHKKVLIVLSSKDTTLIKILSSNTQIKVKLDLAQNFQKYGFQRPGHYAFVLKENQCPIQYLNITKSFIEWFVSQ